MKRRATSRTASRTASRTGSFETTNIQPSPNTKSGSAGSGLLTQVGPSYRLLSEEDSRPTANHARFDQMLLATLTCRDVAILLALDQYRYLDRHQLEQLFFQGPRSAQLRLRYLSESGLVLRWRMRRKPGRVLRPWIFLLSSRGARLLAEVSGITSTPFVKRAEHAQTAAFHVLHDIEANAFFVDVATASSATRDQGLYHWVGERGCWRAYAEAHELGPIPDGWGRYLLPEGEVIFFLEWDRATLRRSRIRSKVSQYRTYFRGRQRAATTNVLFVVPSVSREAQIREEILAVIRDAANESCRFWTTTTERLQNAGPLGSIWRSSVSGIGLKRLGDLPKQSRSSYLLEGCIGKPAWWERRPAGGQGA
jgi:hypothetical protein